MTKFKGWNRNSVKSGNRHTAKSNQIIKTNNSIIIGFDGDINKSGIGIYNSATDEVLDLTTKHFNDIPDYLDNLIDSVGKKRIVGKIEVPTFGTAIGSSKGKDGAALRKILFYSGESSTFAQLFIDLLERRNIPTIKILSSQRANMSKMKGLTPSQLFSPVLSALQSSKMPSKLTKAQMFYFYPQLKLAKEEGKEWTFNEESFDALLLTLPERIQRFKR